MVRACNGDWVLDGSEDVIIKDPYNHVETRCTLGQLVKKVTKTSIHQMKSYDVDRIVRNGPATIVFWADGTKTIVKRKKGDRDEPYYAFTAALAKKVYENNSQIKSILEKLTIDETKKGKKS